MLTTLRGRFSKYYLRRQVRCTEARLQGPRVQLCPHEITSHVLTTLRGRFSKYYLRRQVRCTEARLQGPRVQLCPHETTSHLLTTLRGRFSKYYLRRQVRCTEARLQGPRVQLCPHEITSHVLTTLRGRFSKYYLRRQVRCTEARLQGPRVHLMPNMRSIDWYNQIGGFFPSPRSPCESTVPVTMMPSAARLTEFPFFVVIFGERTKMAPNWRRSKSARVRLLKKTTLGCLLPVSSQPVVP